ncbi:MAG: YHS domain-containing protein [Elusimicrobiota bacterium]|jgi:DNA-binding protein HU-beta
MSKTVHSAFCVLILSALAASAQPDQQSAPAAAPAQVEVKKAPAAKKAAKAKKAPAAKKIAAAVEDYQPQASEFGVKAKCPVSGDELTVAADTLAVKYKGKIFYFCCAACAPAFKATPDKFVKP